MTQINKLDLTVDSSVAFNEYAQFVDGVSSEASTSLDAFIAHLQKIKDSGQCDTFSRMMTGFVGMASESGEALDIMKKVMFQGKELDDKTQTHLKKELGDVIFYWTQCCIALGIDPAVIIETNKNKLAKRFPDGFEVARSENRVAGDI